MKWKHIPADPSSPSPFDRVADYYIVEDYDMAAIPKPSPEFLREVEKSDEETKEIFRKLGIIK
ncbi:MAG: hypothetical protein A3H69_04020 [Candidatus Sungbacteria bacterium RIFCSPLOWO2_02_FULL_47_9]|uniref:Uncharacterized protein n=1 Tax=Candidatus Sungbacteria bacterium RIFCSPHIGHO2_01_FULL_47_32 TaxID=1802264 RepID=A0A1G2K7F0_9BACT|nr:MAG: hypothetical protein UX72_C0049G0007 [Parcubacteria group bacterium GW2011_GWA2_47_10]OGZ95369.1 MAG: hypothetical protein A2633_04265 [Candidatus Sungbacteria bacterium RIFCSPHIGHO2_01_FULL_47_32]OGZ98866.1 MAG: hypothetical protein A3D57_03920 [Candidatus Sungbacteria bacterium RIFCSPHIGHO2_02_FULL_46_12]OHA05235.1 MAG: hypothetical protein A3A28_04185 [Candidatus Sungbacteria bacterium RIFCSPLOWO2_01_FULL_47_32]OHA10330.1 MAG: hypothetical protein A3H69_04020 [Candidatus Sungbacteria